MGSKVPNPNSCDTFVVLPPLTAHGGIVFGKNSDRPNGEVQEVVYFDGGDHSSGSKLQCTYIEIDQAAHTCAVVLSKPSWMWGAEMGSNENGVCIGNEAVWTKLCSENDLKERLLGMDLVRLGLERGATARGALDAIVENLEKYGQGGPCSDQDPDFSYHNSFLLADPSEAWVLETAGHLWAAQKITAGFRNISNALSIETEIDLMSDQLKSYAVKEGLWNEKDEFNFSQVFSSEGKQLCERYTKGRNLLKTKSDKNGFGLEEMIEVLRDTKSGICRPETDPFHTSASQISVLGKPGSARPNCHWFTGTPNPAKSVFKPFIFGDGAKLSKHVQSPHIPESEDPAKVSPRFQTQVDREHDLYRLHKKFLQSNKTSGYETMKGMERQCIEDMEVFLTNFQPSQYSEVEDLFKDCVESEMKLYK